MRQWPFDLNARLGLAPCAGWTRTLGITAFALTVLGCSGQAARQDATSAGASAPPTSDAASAGTAGAGAGRAGNGGSGVAGREPERTAAAGSAGMADAGSASPADSGAASPSGGSPAPVIDASVEPSPNEGDSDAGARDSGAVDAAAEEPPAIACPATALSPGETRATLMHDGRMREFLIYVPSGYDNSGPVPLVLNFHGATMTAEQQRDFSSMNPTADAKGFVVVYPQGVGNSWNAGACCGEAQSSNVDDVGFARAMLQAVGEKVCIDPRRTYSAGFSNGGRMSYRLGCEMADVFAAIGPVAGTKSFPDDSNGPGCQPAQPISLIDIMGSADPRSSAQPGQIAEWVAFNGCTDATPTESYRQGQHYCSTYSQCKDGTSVTFCMVDGGDHCWPGSYPCILGNTSRPEELSANDLIWDLFQRSMR